MELVTIDSRRILVEFEPTDCLILATVCRQAAEHASHEWSSFRTPAPLFPRPEHLTALVAAFEAMAMAYSASSFAIGGQMDEEYTLAHIRRDWNPLHDVTTRPAAGAGDKEEGQSCA